MTLNRRGQSGFTLVEVLVASSIAIASMGLLLNLFGAGLDRMARVELQSQQLIVEKAVTLQLAEVNPAAETQGEGRAGDWVYRWQTTRITPFRQGTDFIDGAIEPRDFALFLISIDLQKPGRNARSFELRQVGWRS